MSPNDCYLSPRSKHNAVISTGDGDDTVVGSGNTINEAFSFNFDLLLT